MNRPLCIATVFYILGIIMGLYLKMSIAFFIVFLIFIVFCFYINLKEKRNCILKFLLFILVLIIGIINIKQLDSAYEKFYKSIEKQDEVQIEAIVVSSEEEKDYSYTYEIKILKIDGNEKYKGIKMILNLKKSKQKENMVLQYGDYITAKGEFNIPDTARNYGGFDYREYLKSKKIYGTIYVKENIELLAREKGTIFGKIVHDIQNSIKNNMREILPKETSDLCVGILIGIRNDISEEVELNFKESNLTHMLAVSGSHVTYIILGLTAILSKTDKKVSKVVTILFLIFFMVLTGCTPSVIRACIMGIIMLISKLVYRRSDIWTNLALSTLTILLINPYTILDIGFQLSYGGTIGIVLLSKKMSEFIKGKINIRYSVENQKNNVKHKKEKQRVHIKNNIISKIMNYIIDTLAITFSANIIIIPIMAFRFNTVSLTFWISNLLASPFMGVVVILGFIVYMTSVASIGISKIIAIPLNIILMSLLKIAEVCSKIPFSSIIVKTPYVISIMIYYFIIILILNRKFISGKLKTIIMNKMIKSANYKKYKIHNKEKIIQCAVYSSIMFSIIFGIFIHNSKKNLKIYFIDVGQGDSTLIITPSNKKILIDGGGSELGSYNVGEKTLLPYLLDRRITTLDYIMISHFDTDHVRTVYYI